MPAKIVAPYGSWKTPISPDMLVSTSSGIGRATQVALDGDDIYWTEARPEEGGRVVVIKRSPDGEITELTPPPFNVRTTVYEYGGGAYAVKGGVIYFSDFSDQRLYRLQPGGVPGGADARVRSAVRGWRRGCCPQPHVLRPRGPLGRRRIANRHDRPGRPDRW